MPAFLASMCVLQDLEEADPEESALDRLLRDREKDSAREAIQAELEERDSAREALQAELDMSEAETWNNQGMSKKCI